MYKVSINIHSEPTKEPTISIDVMKKKYSLPKLYIPKMNNKPTVEPGKRWYVYFYYRNPETDKLTKFKYSHNINRFPTVKQRKAVGKALIEAYTTMLVRGFNPFSKKKQSLENKKIEIYTLEKALREAFDLKRHEWSSATITGNEFWMNNFIEWLKENNLSGMLLNSIESSIIVEYLNDLTKQGKGSTTINNARSSISSLFGKLLKDRKIEYNPVRSIEKRKTSPIKNKPFTVEQIKKIKDYLMRNDVYLYHYLKFIMYAFLRNREVVRLKVGDIDITNKVLYVKTKTEGRAAVRIIEPLTHTIKELNLLKFSPSFNAFSMKQEPSFWDVKEKSKVDWFGNRFKKIKAHFELGNEYGIYSFRHTAAVDVFTSFKREGFTKKEAMLKMMEITRHKSEEGLENYLREIGAFMPKDYAKRYSIDF